MQFHRCFFSLPRPRQMDARSSSGVFRLLFVRGSIGGHIRFKTASQIASDLEKQYKSLIGKNLYDKKTCQFSSNNGLILMEKLLSCWSGFWMDPVWISISIYKWGGRGRELSHSPSHWVWHSGRAPSLSL